MTQRDSMDVLQAWVEDFNTVAQPALPLSSGGEAGGAQLRLRVDHADGNVSILHLVAVAEDDRPTIRVRRFDGTLPDTVVQAGLWASGELGRRPRSE